MICGETSVHGLPLPPEIPGRVFRPQFNGYGQYLLTPPGGGLPQGFSRASTVAEALDDHWLLHRWEIRQVIIGLTRSVGLSTDAAQVVTEWDAEGRPPMSKAQKAQLNTIGEEAQASAGSSYAAEFGSCTHQWSEYLDHGLCTLSQVPELVRAHCYAYMHLLACYAYSSIPALTERTVLHPLRIAGTLDRGLLGPDGKLVLGDVKTSKGLEFSEVAYAIQLAAYHGADMMRTVDGAGWEAAPPWRGDYAVLIHLPSHDAGASSLITFDMHRAYQLLNLAMLVRAERKAKDTVMGKHALPVPSEQQAEYAAAVLDIQTSDTPEQMGRVWEAHKGIWSDALTQLANRQLHLSQLTERSNP